MKNAKKLFKIALVQMKMSAEPQKNLANALKKICLAAKRGAKIVCLPELFTTFYFPQSAKNQKYFVAAEKIPGPTTKALASAAKQNKVVLIGGSIFEKSGRKFYNTSVVFGPNGKLLGKYRKTHIPHDPSFYEQNYFSCGDLGYKVFSTPFGKIAPLICYDQWFPEAARALALKGAEIIFYPTAIGTLKNVQQVEGNWYDAWQTVQRGHAIANNVFVAAVNRVGKEGKMNFFGGSFVSGPFGKILAKASHSREEILIAKINLSECSQVKKGWRFFKNRRPDTYKALLHK